MPDFKKGNGNAQRDEDPWPVEKSENDKTGNIYPMKPFMPEELYPSCDEQDNGSQGLEAIFFLTSYETEEHVHGNGEKGEGKPDCGSR
jgi:hypothetical protein